jgi:hypothetical protein
LQIIVREALLNDGLWYTLPPDKGWDDAAAGGIALGMLALRRGDFVLALFPGDPQPGQLYMVGLNIPLEEIAGVRSRLTRDVEVLEYEPDSLMFRDPNMITWQIYPTGTEFRSSGESAERWLDV